MESKEFFEGDTIKPSVITVVVDQCVEAFAPYYHLNKAGSFYIEQLGKVYPVTDGELTDDIRDWLYNLEGGDPMKDRLNTMIQGNPGWQLVIARRAIKELRRRADQ